MMSDAARRDVGQKSSLGLEIALAPVLALDLIVQNDEPVVESSYDCQSLHLTAPIDGIHCDGRSDDHGKDASQNCRCFDVHTCNLLPGVDGDCQSYPMIRTAADFRPSRQPIPMMASDRH